MLNKHMHTHTQVEDWDTEVANAAYRQLAEEEARAQTHTHTRTHRWRIGTQRQPMLHTGSLPKKKLANLRRKWLQLRRWTEGQQRLERSK